MQRESKSVVDVTKKWVWCLLLLSLSGLAAMARAEVSVDEDPIKLRSTGQLYFLVDQSGQLTLSDVLAATGHWQRVTDKVEPKRDETVVWLRVRLAATDKDRQLVLFHAVPRRLTLQVYAMRNTGAASTPAVASQPLKALSGPRYLCPFEMRADVPVDLYIRVSHGVASEAINFLQIWPNEKMLEALPGMNALEWVNISIMLVVAFTSLVAWLFVRQPLLWLLAVLVGVQWFFYSTSHGYSPLWFIPGSPGLTALSSEWNAPISMVINVWFTAAFLELGRYAPRLNRAAMGIIAGLLVIGIIMSTQPVSREGYVLLPILICQFFLLGTCYYLYKNSIRRGSAGVMLLCWITWFVLTVAVLAVSATDPSRQITRYAYDFSIQLRLMLFIVCIVYQYRETIRSEERARAEAYAKSEFLARMSHEIRTPMNGVLGMSELLRDAGLNSTQRRYNEIVYSSATALLTVINDILDFSKIQAGRMSIESIPFDLHRVAAEALTFFRIKADEKNLELLCDIRPSVPAWVIGDPLRIRQILINFLSNAIKFTDSGEIRLRLARRDGFIRISVEDTGPGIAKDTQSRLFASFMQADMSIARQYGGTGLGLAISAQLSELMGGKIGVQSELGRGSTFWVDLPLKATAHQEPLHGVADLHGKSILVVDDNAHFCELVAECAKAWQADVQIVYSGAEALARVSDCHARNHNFDMISIDLKMPGMNGLELAHALKASYGENLPPLLLLTVATDIPQVAARRAAGIVMVQEKPVIPCDLRDSFGRVLGLVTREESAADRSEAILPMLKALTLLVVEDNLVNQMVIVSMLKKLGHDCVAVAGGEEAVARYRDNPNAFDVVLMDCEMPGMSGFDATRMIRRHEREQRLPRKPIMALTAHTLEEHVEQCYLAGMDGHLAKPLVLERLRELLEGLASTIAP
ncbi:MAG TPA: response regulator [Spongiibacteraceae bacterium]|nr:response regulator [Spongiibacteraceae bacterium]